MEYVSISVSAGLLSLFSSRHNSPCPRGWGQDKGRRWASQGKGVILISPCGESRGHDFRYLGPGGPRTCQRKAALGILSRPQMSGGEASTLPAHATDRCTHPGLHALGLAVAVRHVHCIRPGELCWSHSTLRFLSFCLRLNLWVPG